MPEKDFQREVLEQLAEIKTHQKYFSEGLTEIKKHGERITKNEESTKSAHHRIDGIFYGAGILGGIAGWAGNLIASLLGKGGGHG